MESNNHGSFIDSCTILFQKILFFGSDQDSRNRVFELFDMKVLYVEWNNNFQLITLTVEKAVVVIGVDSSCDQSIRCHIADSKIYMFVLTCQTGELATL